MATAATAAAAVPSHPPATGLAVSGGCGGAVVIREWISTATAVTTTAAIHAGNIRTAKAPPETCSWPNTNRFVRLEPGSSSDAALAMSSAPSRNGSSATPRRRAVSTSTGVRKATDVSRLSTAVTTAASARSATSSTAGPPRTRAAAPAARSKVPSSLATQPISSNPATSTKGGQVRDAAARAAPGAATTATASAATPARRRIRRKTGATVAAGCAGPAASVAVDAACRERARGPCCLHLAASRFRRAMGGGGALAALCWKPAEGALPSFGLLSCPRARNEGMHHATTPPRQYGRDERQAAMGAPALSDNSTTMLTVPALLAEARRRIGTVAERQPAGSLAVVEVRVPEGVGAEHVATVFDLVSETACTLGALAAFDDDQGHYLLLLPWRRPRAWSRHWTNFCSAWRRWGWRAAATSCGPPPGQAWLPYPATWTPRTAWARSTWR